MSASYSIGFLSFPKLKLSEWKRKAVFMRERKACPLVEPQSESILNFTQSQQISLASRWLKLPMNSEFIITPLRHFIYNWRLRLLVRGEPNLRIRGNIPYFKSTESRTQPARRVPANFISILCWNEVKSYFRTCSLLITSGSKRRIYTKKALAYELDEFYNSVIVTILSNDHLVAQRVRI